MSEKKDCEMKDLQAAPEAAALMLRLAASAERDFEAGYLDTMDDGVFQFVFGKPECRKFIIAFLNAVLAQELGRKIKDIQFENAEFPRESCKDRETQLDIRCQLDNGGHADAEVRVINKHRLQQTNQSSISRDDDYENVRPAFVINILDYKLFDDERPCRIFAVCDTKTGEQVFTDFGFIYIEVPKIQRWIKEKAELTDAEKWMCFFDRSLTVKQRIDCCNKEGIIIEAMERAGDFFADLANKKRYIDKQILRMDREQEI